MYKYFRGLASVAKVLAQSHRNGYSDCTSLLPFVTSTETLHDNNRQ